MNTNLVTFQRRIQDFPDADANSKGDGRSNLSFGQIFPKLHKNEEKLGLEGETRAQFVYADPPLHLTNIISKHL